MQNLTVANLTVLGHIVYSDNTSQNTSYASNVQNTSGIIRDITNGTTRINVDDVIFEKNLAIGQTIDTAAMRTNAIQFMNDLDPNGNPTFQTAGFSNIIKQNIEQNSTNIQTLQSTLSALIPSVINPSDNVMSLHLEYDPSNGLASEITPGLATISNFAQGSNTTISPLMIQFNNNGLAPYISHTGNEILISGNSQGVGIDSNSGVCTIGDFFGPNNNTTIVLDDNARSISLNSINLMCDYNYITLPVSYTFKYDGAFYYGNIGTNNWEMVRQDTINNLPQSFYNPASQFREYRIDIVLNMFNMQNPGDKAQAQYIVFRDSNGNYYVPFVVNQDVPYARHSNSSTYSQSVSDMQLYSWTDTVSFANLDGNNGAIPLQFELYWYADNTNSANFRLLIHFTRTNLVN